MHAHELLRSLALVLSVGAVATILFQRLRLPVVLGYIVAGLVIGPHVPVPLVASPDVVETLSGLGVILLMFSLGLEFSVRGLLRVGPTAALTAVVETSVMICLGFAAGRLLGFTEHESLFTGAIVAISSTTILAKAFDEENVRGRLREVVVGILVVEDLIAIVLMATLTAVGRGAGLSASALAATTGRLVAFLVVLLVGGLLVVPRAIRAVQKLERPEISLVTSVAICFAMALLAEKAGYSVALGAFVAGSLIAESGEQKAIEHLVAPVRDLFGAVFFVSVGMLLDPALVAANAGSVALLALVVIVGKILGVTTGAFLTGNGVRLSLRAGMSLAQIGEFSFILAGLGLSLGATRDFLYPVAIAVSAITTVTTPLLVRVSEPVAARVDARLPRSLQTFASLYGTWLERLRKAPPERAKGARVRGLVRLIVLDVVILALLVAGASLTIKRTASLLEVRHGFGEAAARSMVIAATGLIGLPFALGVLRLARRLGETLAEAALPGAAKGQVDPSIAPRRALVVTFQLAATLLLGLPLVAITQPFLPGLEGALVLALVLVPLGFVFWRNAASLQGHVRAGAEMVVEVLAAQARSGDGESGNAALAQVHELLPGLGEPVPVVLGERSPAAGKTLAELNLRGATGAFVLAISRGDAGVVVPSAKERLLAGDVLALSGTHDAITSARRLLEGPDGPAGAIVVAKGYQCSARPSAALA